VIAAWLSVLGYMGLIFALSASSLHTPFFKNAQKIHLDWLAHIVEYAFLGFLLVRALKRSTPRLAGAGLYAAVLATGIFYAATDEYHQSFVPTRDASVQDGVADTAGLALGVWLWTRRQKGLKTHA